MPQVTGAPFPITLGDFTYEMSPLTDKDIDEINNWIRASFITMARNSLTPDMSTAEREELLGVAMSRARKLSFLEGEGSEIASSLDGSMRVLWQGLRKRTPDLSYETFMKRVWALKNIDENALAKDITAALAVWKTLNVPEGEKKAPAASEDPAEKKQDT